MTEHCVGDLLGHVHTLHSPIQEFQTCDIITEQYGIHISPPPIVIAFETGY